MPSISSYRALLALLVLFGSASVAHAQRAFVSAKTGSDSNPCTLVSPCRSFSTALGAVSAGGEIVALDSGGYGPVTIGKSITIESPPGIYAGITAPSGDAITVNACSAVVVLRGLTLNVGAGNGVSWTGCGTLHIENCVISGFAGDGVRATTAPGTADSRSHLLIKDSIIRENTGRGIYLTPASEVLRVSIDRCRVEHNGSTGILGISTVNANVVAVVRDTVLASNKNGGLGVDSALGGTARAFADRCSASNNSGNAGMYATGNQSAILSVQASSIAYNGTGLAQLSGATVETIGDNMVRGNSADKVGTITVLVGD